MPEAGSQEARFFARLSQELMSETEEQPTLQTVVERAVEVVGPCDLAGISLRRRRGRLETVASTDDLAVRCDQLQYALGEGPCVDAALQEDWYFAPDLERERRWPAWAPRALEEGAHSVLSIRLSNATEIFGALNLYSKSPDNWTPDDIDHALVYTAHAANALSTARIATGLQIALEGRHRIGIAQGMLMLRYELTQAQSFEALRRLSSQRNIKLRDLAEQVVNARGLTRDLLGEDEPGG